MCCTFSDITDTWNESDSSLLRFRQKIWIQKLFEIDIIIFSQNIEL